MVILVNFGHFATFSGIFGHFGGILGRFWIGAFWGISSRWGLRGRRPLIPQHPPTIPISLIVPMYHTEVLVCELHVAASERISAWRWNWTRSSSPRARRPHHPASRPSGCLLPRRWMRTAAPPDESSSVSSSPAAITMDVHRKADGRRAFRAPTGNQIGGTNGGGRRDWGMRNPFGGFDAGSSKNSAKCPR